MVLPSDLSSVSRSLHQGRLLLRFDTLTGQREIYERFSVRKPKELGHWSLRIGIFPGTLQYFILLFSLNFVIATK